jgi:hypothetical protein
MREANVAIPFQYAYQDGASTSGSMHRDGMSTSGSAQWRHQDASGDRPWRHQNASENEPWRHQDVAQTGGSVSLRIASDQDGAARSDRLSGSRQLSLAYQTPSQPPSSSTGSRPPIVHEDSGIRGLGLLISEDLLRMEELPPLYSAE